MKMLATLPPHAVHQLLTNLPLALKSSLGTFDESGNRFLDSQLAVLSRTYFGLDATNRDTLSKKERSARCILLKVRTG
jgi:hypothetical protein